MLSNRTLYDIAGGVGLGFVLLLIVVTDRLLSSPTPDGDASAGRKTGTLLGDSRIAVHLKAIGSEERLEKLRVVRLTTKASFAKAKNVNDIVLTWCWEPKITIRFSEVLPDTGRELLTNIILRDAAARERFLQNARKNFDAEGDQAARFDPEARKLVDAKNLKPFFDAAILIEGKEVYRIFNDRLSFPIKGARAHQMRNLCFALSVSNLIPIRRHNFELKPGDPDTVRGRKCDQFVVQDPDGLKLQFYFDHETHLLAKISHMGHDPRSGAGPDKQVRWDHYFSDYRETEGIKQWRKLEVDLDGERFSTLEVTAVQFFDEMRSELRRPDR